MPHALSCAPQVSMAAPCLHPATPPARALLAATHFLYTFVVVAAMLVVVTLLGAAGAWMPALQRAVCVPAATSCCTRCNADRLAYLGQSGNAAQASFSLGC
eukprot:scaffold206167_cov27-Tisochrysis_lutea.AAC.1